MRRLGIGQNRDIGLCKFAEVTDITGFSRAHLDNGKRMLRRNIQERERHTQFVVVIPRRRQHGGVARQNRRQHFLGTGLTTASSKRDQRPAERTAVISGKVRQSPLTVIHNHTRQLLALPVNQGCRCAGFCGLPKVVMTVHALTTQRDKEAASTDPATINDHRADLGVLTIMFAVGQRRHCIKRKRTHHADALLASARRAVATSLKGRRSPAIS